MARHERFLVFLSLTTRFCIFCIFSWHRLANLIQLPEKGMSHLAFIIRVADQFLRCLLSHLKFLSLWIEIHTNQLAWTDTLWHENICPENGKQWTHKRWWCIEGEHIHIPIKFPEKLSRWSPGTLSPHNGIPLLQPGLSSWTWSSTQDYNTPSGVELFIKWELAEEYRD